MGNLDRAQDAELHPSRRGPSFGRASTRGGHLLGWVLSVFGAERLRASGFARSDGPFGSPLRLPHRTEYRTSPSGTLARRRATKRFECFISTSASAASLVETLQSGPVALKGDAGESSRSSRKGEIEMARQKEGDGMRKAILAFVMVAIVVAVAQPAGAVDDGFRGRYRIIGRGGDDFCPFPSFRHRVHVRFVNERFREFVYPRYDSTKRFRYDGLRPFPWYQVLERPGASSIALRYRPRTGSADGFKSGGPQCTWRVRVVPIGPHRLRGPKPPTAASTGSADHGVGTIAPDVYQSGATSGGAARTDRFRLPYGGY